MQKIILGLLMPLVLNMAFANSVNESVAIVSGESQAMVKSSTNHLIGGWSPVFFTNYDESQVKQIINMVQHKTIRKIKITYPSSQQKLAIRIKQQIESSSTMKPSMELMDLKDTPSTKYTHNTVVLTLYYAKPQ